MITIIKVVERLCRGFRIRNKSDLCRFCGYRNGKINLDEFYIVVKELSPEVWNQKPERISKQIASAHLQKGIEGYTPLKI